MHISASGVHAMRLRPVARPAMMLMETQIRPMLQTWIQTTFWQFFVDAMSHGACLGLAGADVLLVPLARPGLPLIALSQLGHLAHHTSKRVGVHLTSIKSLS